MYNSRPILAFILLVLTSTVNGLHSQNDSKSLADLVDEYLANNEVNKADSLVNLRLTHFKSNNQIDSLYQFPELLGKITLNKSNAKRAGVTAEAFIDRLKEQTSNARTLFKAYLSLDQLYLYLGDDTSCVAASKKALEYATTLDDITPEELGKINYVIGGNYYALYELSNAVDYFKASAKAYENSDTVEKHILADSYNGVAVSMWTLNKLDSAKVYFNKAIFATEESDLTSFDRTYYINAFKFNLALVIDAQGHISEAIEIKKEIIQNLQNIIDSSDDVFLVTKSKRLQASAISNLAAFYHDTGYLTRAYDMLRYAYQKKKDVFEANSPRLATTSMQIATSEIELQEFDKSIATTTKALKNLKTSNSTYLSVEADLIYTQGKAYKAKGETDKTLKLFQESEALYNKAYPEEYSREYLIFLRDYAVFLAENTNYDQAIDMAQKAYDYILKNGGENNLPLLKEIVNLSEVHFICGNYNESNQWAKEGIKFIENRLQNIESNMNVAQIEFYKPQLLLLDCKSRYRLQDSKDSVFLESILDELNDATVLLENRKTTIFKTEDINQLLQEYKSITDFSKQVALVLYNVTDQSKYMDKVIELHESAIYNRIRSRLNLKDNIAFADIPKSILNREQKLRSELSNSINASAQISNYFETSVRWEHFVDSLKLIYPKYYEMRYATIEESLEDLQTNIPEGNTVVRYLFIESNLYAFIAARNKKNLYKLDFSKIEKYIDNFTEIPANIQEASKLYYDLYQYLWKPFEVEITTNKVTIVPDAELFNLSFETLTPSPITSFREIANNSLLAKHTIAYNYSLLLLKKRSNAIDYNKDFIAFAPEFNETMKNDYKVAIKDTLGIDQAYLNLLPQPFSVDLAKEFSRVFRGDSYINENATKQLFISSANEHKIIHIGTHAESDNVSPELSRLVFAKSNSNTSDINENYLYTYEIYNQNLNSDLAILTACETGKPTYQSGEGMISLAHAFNYAGSESILTSLWKIDEKSSTEIIKYFYENITKGLSKSEALKQAKLTYLSAAEGRTITPQYWAGLVLIGDTSPIEIKTFSSSIIWLLTFAVLLILILVLIKYRST